MTEPVQGELLGPATMPAGGVGRLEVAARRSVAAAHLDDRDEAGAELVVYLARQLDRAGTASKQYVIAPLAQQYREALAQYGLDPSSRGGDASDPLLALLGELSAPSVGDSPHS